MTQCPLLEISHLYFLQRLGLSNHRTVHRVMHKHFSPEHTANIIIKQNVFQSKQLVDIQI